MPRGRPRYDQAMIGLLDVSNGDLADRIVAIQRAAYAVEAELMQFDGIPQLHETSSDITGLSHLRWAGSFEGDTLVGLTAWTIRDAIVDIDRLAVDPQFARKGHGRRLVEYASAGTDAIVSTGAANTPARLLYESLGFDVTSHREVAPGVMVVEMRRRSVQTEKPA